MHFPCNLHIETIALPMPYGLASLFGLWTIAGGAMNLLVTLYLNVLKEFQMFLK